MSIDLGGVRKLTTNGWLQHMHICGLLKSLNTFSMSSCNVHVVTGCLAGSATLVLFCDVQDSHGSYRSSRLSYDLVTVLSVCTGWESDIRVLSIMSMFANRRHYFRLMGPWLVPFRLAVTLTKIAICIVICAAHSTFIHRRKWTGLSQNLAQRMSNILKSKVNWRQILTQSHCLDWWRQSKIRLKCFETSSKCHETYIFRVWWCGYRQVLGHTTRTSNAGGESGTLKARLKPASN